MKKLNIIIISLIAIIAFEVCASDLHEISDMYIESQGNNKYEAKIKLITESNIRQVHLKETTIFKQFSLTHCNSS